MLKNNLLTKKQINFYLVLLKLSVKRLKLSKIQFEFLILLEFRLQNNCNCLSRSDKQFINFLINQNKKYLDNLKSQENKKTKEIIIRAKKQNKEKFKSLIYTAFITLISISQ